MAGIRTKRAKVFGSKWCYYIRVDGKKLPLREFKQDILFSRSWIQVVHRYWKITILWDDGKRVKYFIDNYSDF
jgi:hypothetical protein